MRNTVREVQPYVNSQKNPLLTHIGDEGDVVRYAPNRLLINTHDGLKGTMRPDWRDTTATNTPHCGSQISMAMGVMSKNPILIRFFRPPPLQLAQFLP